MINIVDNGMGPANKIARTVPGLSVVVPAHNAAQTLEQCLEALRKSLPAGTELVVVDDGSLDDTREIASRLCDHVVVLPCQSGAARARNEGIRVAGGDIILLVDSDVQVNESAVKGLLQALESGVDAVFGAYQSLPPPGYRSAATDYKNLIHHLTHVTGGPRAVTTLWSGFSALNRGAFEAVGGFDPAVTQGADVEDIHLGYRLTAAGYRIAVAPHCQVQHLKRYTAKSLVVSDVVHRAIPWTRAMLELRTFRSELTLAGSSLFGVLTFLVGAAFTVTAPFLNLGLGVSASIAIVSIGGWLWTQRRLLSSCMEIGGVKFGLAALGFGAAFCFYAPAGAAIGSLAFILRPRNDSVRNTSRVEQKSEPFATLLTIAIVPRPGGVDAHYDELLALFPVDARYEVVALMTEPMRSAMDTPNTSCRILPIRAGDDMQIRLAKALVAARGQGIAFLEPGLQPAENWINEAVKAVERGFLVTGGSFETLTRSPKVRAAVNGWLWPWRPERQRCWMEDHPIMNAVFDTTAVRQIGGIGEPGTILHRLSVFGNRTVHFDPALRVAVAEHYHHGSMRERYWVSRTHSDGVSTYCDLSVALRIGRVLHTPAAIAQAVVRLIHQSYLAGTLDRVFVSSLPRTVKWILADRMGVLAGLCKRNKNRQDHRRELSSSRDH